VANGIRAVDGVRQQICKLQRRYRTVVILKDHFCEGIIELFIARLEPPTVCRVLLQIAEADSRRTSFARTRATLSEKATAAILKT
jgi:hypothetical protein